MNFKRWLNEIAPTGRYGDLVPGWRGGPKGPFDDPKRMPHDPLFSRNFQYNKARSQAEFEKAKKDMEKDPDAKDRYAKAAADALWNAMPTVPEGKPRGEYQGWTNWDTWLVALWASNEREHYEALRGKSAAYLRKYASQQKYRRELDNFAGGEEDPIPVDLDVVNWEEIKGSLDG